KRGTSSIRSSRPGQTKGHPTSRTMTPGHGDPTPPTSCLPATADAGAGSEPVAMTVTEPVLVGEPVLRWSARAHSIAEIELQLARIWSEQDLTATVDGEPGRHVAARTSVMNLIVIVRRPEIAERCAATMQLLTGRHPSRTIV